MKNGKRWDRYRITLDRNTLIIDRVCESRGNDDWAGPGAVVEELDAEQGLLHAIVEWVRPKVVYTDNWGCESVRLVRACERLGIAVIQPSLHAPQAKGRAERLSVLRGRGR
jgi:hypothetical protein